MDNETAKSYNKNADAYEQQWERYLKHTHRKFLAETQTKSTDIILDASCGTGLLARELIDAGYPFEKIVLNDISEQMQQKARKRFKDHPDISFSRYDWPNSNFDTESFTKIFCLNAFHNYPHHRQVIEHFGELLQPGGELLILDWNNSGLFRPVNWLINRWTPETINTISLAQMQNMLGSTSFRITHKEDWCFKYWRLYLIKAEKVPS